MATADEIVAELEALGSEATKRVLVRHGAREPLFGVKVEYLKKIQKRVKTDHVLALALYETGIGDAMYLAGLIADDGRMTKKDLQRWADGASGPMLSEYAVPWVAAGSPHGREMALMWIASKKESVAAAGWCTLSSLASVRPDEELDLDELQGLLDRVRQTIHAQPNRVRYAMNGFVIAVGCCVAPLMEAAVAVARSVGTVEVDTGGTACRVPDAVAAIEKVRAKGTIGKKRKTAKC